MIDFYKKVKRTIREDGLIVSSSNFLVKTMVDKIDFSLPLTMLEMGSGKGVFTREIIHRMSVDSCLDISEIKCEFNHCIKALIANNPGKKVAFYNGCVTELLKEPGKYDVIVSSLPLRNFERFNDNKEFLHKVLDACRYGLKEGGLYLQY
jgi:phospholipid N-methyltransferase